MDKQIEENGKELYNDLSSIMSEEYEKRMLITPSYCAEKMSEKGYRKIPEGAVVLTREAYSDYLVMKDDHQNAIERCAKLQADNERLYKNIGKFKDAVRKETAEKYHTKVNEAIDSVPNATKEFVEAWKAKNDEIAKEITEGRNGEG